MWLSRFAFSFEVVSFFVQFSKEVDWCPSSVCEFNIIGGYGSSKVPTRKKKKKFYIFISKRRVKLINGQSK